MVSKYRFYLHQIPEIGFNEYETQEFIYNIVKNHRCIITKIKTGLVLYYDFKKETSIAFRADMDGLPILEKSNNPNPSKHKGLMHACGHDGHMAMLLSFADYVNSLDCLDKNVVLIFQPAEENIGGAHDIVASNILDKYNVKCIFAFHVWPKLEYGKIYSKKNELMAKSAEINIKIKGKSVHCANFKDGVDALKIGVNYLNDVYEMESKYQQNHLLKFGKMESGVIRNVISDETNIFGTLRTYSDDLFNELKNNLILLSKKYENAKFIFDINEGYPPVINSGELFDIVSEYVDLNELDSPFFQAEDFGVYTQKYKSLFMLLGLGDVSLLHTDTFDFNSNVLNVGVEAYKKILKIKIDLL